MPKRPIDLAPGMYYHVYNRGANRDTLFFSHENYLFFLKRYREKMPIDQATTLAYCLMPNHFHLLIRLESDEFSACMQALGTSYSKAINRQQARNGTLFQGRFQAKRVEDERYLVHLSRYLHQNPVSAKLVAHPADWEFSSYRDYVGLREGTLPRTEIILSEFSSREHYRQFVEEKPQDLGKSFGTLLFEE